MSMNMVKIRSNLADALNRVAYRGERIVLERRGKSVAALVSMEDLALLEEMENRADIRAARNALKEKGGIPLEQIKAGLKALAEGGPFIPWEQVKAKLKGKKTGRRN